MDDIVLEVSNESNRFIISGPLYAFAIGGAIFTYTTPVSFHWVIINFFSLLLLAIVIDRIEYKLVPWDRNDVYKINDKYIYYSSHHNVGDVFQQYQFSQIGKIVYKNNRFNKYIEIWLSHNKYGYEQVFTAPPFWNDEIKWYLLFEEIRKRLTISTEVIIR